MAKIFALRQTAGNAAFLVISPFRRFFFWRLTLLFAGYLASDQLGDFFGADRRVDCQ